MAELRRWVTTTGLTLAGAAGAVLVARAVFVLPSLNGLKPAAVRLAAEESPLGQRLAPLARAHAGKTGVHALDSGEGAFAARVLLADTAMRSIDAQYYIWHKDLTGLLLLDALRRAADRGVAVRLLLDDNGIAGLDPILAEIDRHPNIAVRLYNPFPIRSVKFAAYLFDFFRLNRRMHNKSFTVDGLVTVIGGRNVGDEYFNTGLQPAYVDLDVMAAGAVVPAASADFQRYWDSASAYPLPLIVDEAKQPQEPLATALKAAEQTPQFGTYARALAATDIVKKLVDGDLPLEWTQVALISDDPVKTLGNARRDQLLVGRLADLLGDVGERLDVISPYFVPGARGVEEFLKLRRRGVRVRILTNSMEANDVLLVQSGYAKYRRQLLEGGVELFELKSRNAPTTRKADAGIAGSSGASLHAKTFATDGRRIYIGSFNFDPRSVQLNTEMGLLIDSAAMAERMSHGFDEGINGVSYEVRLGSDGSLEWIERAGDSVTVRHRDPNTSWGSRAMVHTLGLLPIQWML